MSEVFADILGPLNAGLDGAAQLPSADAMLAMAEAVLEAWLDARNEAPDGALVEGFRLLALHRQGCKGTPSFNACRETAREIVYRRNVIAGYDDPAQVDPLQPRLLAVTVRHLALFVGGKLTEAGLGDFCCSSRPLHAAAGAA